MSRQSSLPIIVLVLASLISLFLLRGYRMPSPPSAWIEEVRGFLSWTRKSQRMLSQQPSSTDAAIAATVRTHVSHFSDMFTIVLACGSPFYAVFNETSASYAARKVQHDGRDAAVVELGRKLETLVKIANRGFYIATELNMFTHNLAPGGQIMLPIEEAITKLELVQAARLRLANPNLGSALDRATLRGNMNSLLLITLPKLCGHLMFYMERLIHPISKAVSDFEAAIPVAEALLRDFTSERQAVQERISALPWYDSWFVNVVIGIETQGGAVRNRLALLDHASKDVFDYTKHFVIVHENLKRFRDYIEWYLPYVNSTMAGLNNIHHRSYEAELSLTRKLADTLQARVTPTLPWWDDMDVLVVPPHHVPQLPALNGPHDHPEHLYG